MTLIFIKFTALLAAFSASVVSYRDRSGPSGSGVARSNRGGHYLKIYENNCLQSGRIDENQFNLARVGRNQGSGGKPDCMKADLLMEGLRRGLGNGSASLFGPDRPNNRLFHNGLA